MKKSTIWTAVLALAACGGSETGEVVTPRDGGMPVDGGDGRDELAPLLEPIRAANSLPALAAAVVDVDEGLLALGAVGQRRRGGDEPVTAGDRWHLGSDGKAMTATLAALLVEDGTLRWETTLAEGFPTLAARMDPAFADVTLVELLTHRAGLTGSLARERADVWDRLWEAREPLMDERLWVAEALLTAPPAVPPRSAFRYSNAGYILAGALLEQAAGAPFESLSATRLFQPLGMDSCGFGPAASAGSVDAPWGHRGGEPVPPGPQADNPPAASPAGTVHCTLEDWSAFVALHLRGARGDTGLLPEAAFMRLQAGPGFAAPAEGPDYAYGWLVVNASWAGGTALNHVGSNLLNLANAWLVPGGGRAYLVVTNAGGDAAFAGTDQVVAELVGVYPPG
ncbi:MAG: serine hydrolase domain-containing protein [Myxococcota bacterium]